MSILSSAAEIVSRSRKSPSTNSTCLFIQSGLPRRCVCGSRLSSTRTVQPSRTSRSARCDPIRPTPPRRNRRAVRIDQTNGLKSNSQKIFGRGGESFTKSITALWHQLEIVRQDVDICLFRANRSVNRNALHILTRRLQDCGGGVAKKT